MKQEVSETVSELGSIENLQKNSEEVVQLSKMYFAYVNFLLVL